ncbi:hypothetical protein Y032_0009g584 [Ancylostoma ceylanicum]|uniref:Uncharacterized protein n=1 Tax=Ancylostoma ceylanicum TaxID=53326 RepID=A0A016VHX7_9BILA|nr:hypothetical protein Y032_0009g584 [Ancylostoma ceylanicum]
MVIIALQGEEISASHMLPALRRMVMIFQLTVLGDRRTCDHRRKCVQAPDLTAMTLYYGPTLLWSSCYLPFLCLPLPNYIIKSHSSCGP